MNFRCIHHYEWTLVHSPLYDRSGNGAPTIMRSLRKLCAHQPTIIRSLREWCAHLYEITHGSCVYKTHNHKDVLMMVRPPSLDHSGIRKEFVVCCSGAYLTIKRNYVVKFGTNGVLFAEVVIERFILWSRFRYQTSYSHLCE